MSRRVLGLVLIAVLARAVTAWVVDSRIAGDSVLYQQLATNILDHGAFSASVSSPFEPTAVRPPLFPTLVAATFWLLGRSTLALLLVQLALSTSAAVFLGVAFMKRWPRWGGGAALALALNPFEGAFIATMLTETLSISLMSFGLALLAGRPTRRRLAVAGLVFGLCALAREALLFIPATMGAALILQSGLSNPRRLNRGLRRAALVITAAALVVAPWTLRNFRALGRLVPVSGGAAAYSFWIGTWETDPSWTSGPTPQFPSEAFPSAEHRSRLEAFKGELFQPEAQALLYEMAITNWRQAPGLTALRCLRRTPLMWLGTRTEIFQFRPAALRARGSLVWLAHKALYWTVNTLVIILGFTGIFLALRRGGAAKRLAGLAIAPILLLGVVHFPVHNTESRYSHPVLPILLVAGGSLAGVLTLKLRARWPSRRQTPGVE